VLNSYPAFPPSLLPLIFLHPTHNVSLKFIQNLQVDVNGLSAKKGDIFHQTLKVI